MDKILVEVCVGTHCVMMGSMNIIDAVHSLEEFRRDMDNPCEIEVRAVPCIDICKDGLSGHRDGPWVRVQGKLIEHAESETVMAAIMDACAGRG